MAQSGADLVFIEICTHTTGVGTPEESVSRAKVQRLKEAIRDYIHSSSDDLVCWRVALGSLRAAAIGN